MLKKANSLEIKKNMISNEKPLKTIAITKTKRKSEKRKALVDIKSLIGNWANFYLLVYSKIFLNIVLLDHLHEEKFF